MAETKSSTPSIERLTDICNAVHDAAYRELGHLSSCILSSAALLHVLAELGIDAVPIRVEAAVSGDGPNRYGVVLGFLGDGTRIPAAGKRMWNGHLAVVAAGRYLMDPTIDQVSECHDWIQVTPTVTIVGDEFTRERSNVWIKSGNVSIRYKSLPDKGGFTHAPDWRRSHWIDVAQAALADLSEEWRACPGFPNYSVSNIGRLRRERQSAGAQAGKLLVCRPRNRGYVQTGLSRNGKQFLCSVHRLVALAFLGEPPEGKTQVNHKNGVKADNRVENLEWASPKDDGAHRVRMGLSASGDRHYSRTRPECLARGGRNGSRKHPERVPRGERATFAKLTADQVREIRRRSAFGESKASLAREYGVTDVAVGKIVARVNWRHVH